VVFTQVGEVANILVALMEKVVKVEKDSCREVLEVEQEMKTLSVVSEVVEGVSDKTVEQEGEEGIQEVLVVITSRGHLEEEGDHSIVEQTE